MSKKNLSYQVEMSQNEVLYALDNAGLLEYAQSHGVENLRNALMSITVEKVREYARYEAFIVYAKIPTANDKSQVVENVVSQIQNSPYYCKAKKIVEKAQQIANAVEEPKNTVSKSVEKSNKVEKSNIKEETHMSKKVENAEVNKEMEKLNAELVETMKKLVETTAKQLALENRCAEIVYARTGNNPGFRAASTDCNIPISLGIPSLCVGLCLGGKAHTREEWIAVDSLETGFHIAADLILDCFQGDELIR
jgi:hypothetical protein